VCSSGAARFVKIDPQTVEAMVAEEGGAEAEETFDGVKLRWTLEAKEELRRVPVAYMRRRAKARIEKSARVRKLSTITHDFVLPIVNESVVEAEAIGMAPAPSKNGAQPGHGDVEAAVSAEPSPQSAVLTVQVGALSWSQDAVARLHRVPEGFMRDMTREKIEQYAHQHELQLVTLEVAEKGIEVGRQLMAEMIAGYSPPRKDVKAVDDQQAHRVPTSDNSPAVLNEIPSLPGNHP
jgi:hypothetical protein